MFRKTTILAAVCIAGLFGVALSRAAEVVCERDQSVCFDLDWKTASPDDVRQWLTDGGDANAKEFQWELSPLFFAAHFKDHPEVPDALIAAAADYAFAAREQEIYDLIYWQGGRRSR